MVRASVFTLGIQEMVVTKTKRYDQQKIVTILHLTAMNWNGVLAF
jgi:hypothetical protein